MVWGGIVKNQGYTIFLFCFLQSPPDDIPPTYDDVVEKVPSYQDALEMVRVSVPSYMFSFPSSQSFSPLHMASYGSVTERVQYTEIILQRCTNVVHGIT